MKCKMISILNFKIYGKLKTSLSISVGRVILIFLIYYNSRYVDKIKNKLNKLASLEEDNMQINFKIGLRLAIVWK